MDSMEKRVIRWKRHLLASSVVLSDENIEKLVARGLMWTDTLEQIKGDFSNFGRMYKYLDLLMNTSIDNSAFEAFCDFLDDQHPWLGEELRVELQVEKKQLEVDEYMRKEAAQLVHRFYGNNKKLSEKEKKRLEDLIAVRAQVAKEVWRRNMESSRKSLDVQTVARREREENLEGLIENIENFVEAQKKKISRFSVDVFRSNRMPPMLQKSIDIGSLKGTTSTSNLLLKLEASVEKLKVMATMCILDYEGIREEKRRTLTQLDITDDDAPLDKEVKAAIARIAAQLSKSEGIAKDEEEKVRYLENHLEETKRRYEEQVKDRDQNIRFLASSLEKSQDKFSMSEIELREIKEQLDMANADLSKFRIKSRFLEKTRHYGYGYLYDGTPSEYPGRKHPPGRKEELPRIAGGSPRRTNYQPPSPSYDRKVVTRRAAGKTGVSA